MKTYNRARRVTLNQYGRETERWTTKRTARRDGRYIYNICYYNNEEIYHISIYANNSGNARKVAFDFVGRQGLKFNPAGSFCKKEQ